MFSVHTSEIEGHLLAQCFLQNLRLYWNVQANCTWVVESNDVQFAHDCKAHCTQLATHSAVTPALVSDDPPH